MPRKFGPTQNMYYFCGVLPFSLGCSTYPNPTAFFEGGGGLTTHEYDLPAARATTYSLVSPPPVLPPRPPVQGGVYKQATHVHKHVCACLFWYSGGESQRGGPTGAVSF